VGLSVFDWKEGMRWERSLIEVIKGLLQSRSCWEELPKLIIGLFLSVDKGFIRVKGRLDLGSSCFRD
jgi:hypothetical protein